MASLWLDVEVHADREEELADLFAALHDEGEEGAEEELPEIIIYTPPSWEDWGEAA